MEFLNLWAFIFLIPLFFIKKNRKFEKLKKIIISNPKKNFLFILAYILFVVALARPVINNGIEKVKFNNLKILVAIDASEGMKCKDVYPTRFDGALKKLNQLFKYLDYQNVEVVLVADRVYMVTPFTNDYNSVSYLLNHINRDNFFKSEANFEALKEYYKKIEKPKTEIVFSYHKVDAPFSYVVGLKSCMIDGNVYPTSGGFSYNDGDMKELADKINSISKSKDVVVHKRKELFIYPLAFGILLLFLGLFNLRREI